MGEGEQGRVASEPGHELNADREAELRDRYRQADRWKTGNVHPTCEHGMIAGACRAIRDPIRIGYSGRPRQSGGRRRENEIGPGEQLRTAAAEGGDPLERIDVIGSRELCAV